MLDLGVQREFERALLGGERKFTRIQVSERAGISIARAERMWHALGFATVPDDEVAFTDDDVEALRLVAALEDDDFIDPEMESSLARKLGQTQSRLASWQSAMFLEFLASSKLSADEAIEVAGLLLPAMERLQTYVWRRHLAAAAGRAVAGLRRAGARRPGGRVRRHRQLHPADPTADRGRARPADRAVRGDGRGRGRAERRPGDQVDRRRGAVRHRHRGPGRRGRARAAGRGAPRPRTCPTCGSVSSYGTILIRLGDVYGEVVNLAARLTSECKPGRVLADRELAAALDGHSDYRLRRLRRVSVRGYHHLVPYALQRCGVRQNDLGARDPDHC